MPFWGVDGATGTYFLIRGGCKAASQGAGVFKAGEDEITISLFLPNPPAGRGPKLKKLTG